MAIGPIFCLNESEIYFCGSLCLPCCLNIIATLHLLLWLNRNAEVAAFCFDICHLDIRQSCAFHVLHILIIDCGCGHALYGLYLPLLVGPLSGMVSNSSANCRVLSDANKT